MPNLVLESLIIFWYLMFCIKISGGAGNFVFCRRLESYRGKAWWEACTFCGQFMSLACSRSRCVEISLFTSSTFSVFSLGGTICTNLMFTNLRLRTINNHTIWLYHFKNHNNERILHTIYLNQLKCKFWELCVVFMNSMWEGTFTIMLCFLKVISILFTNCFSEVTSI